MKYLLSSVVLICSTAALTAADLTKLPGAADINGFKAAGWKTAATQLREGLLRSYKPVSASDPAMQKWLLVLHWLKFLDDAAYPVAGTTAAPTALVDEFIADAALGTLLFQNLKPEDNRAAVLAILADIRTKQPAAWKTHQALAVAMAVVFDTPLPRGWPHGQVNPEAVPMESADLPVAERFAFWIESETGGKLLLDPKKLEVEQLKFVVDTWLTRDELRWAQKNIRFPRAGFGQAFSSIKYDTPRLDTGKYDWQGDSYALVEIQKTGGICVDQAYFAAMAGKARGLPTLMFSGEGNRGGHAWLGYMKSDDKWELNEGRYAYDNYATGSAMDPQTWKPMTDHELTYLASRFRNRPEYAIGRFHLQFADLFKEVSSPAGEKTAVENAIRACPDDADAWDRRTACLVAAAVPDKDLRVHYEAAIRQFTRNPDMKAEYTRKYVEVLRKTGDTVLADKLERSMVTANTKERSDLSMETAKARLDELLAAKQWDEAYKHYDWILNRLGKNSSGPVFNDVVKPFVVALSKAEQYEIAIKAVRGAKRDLDLAKLNDDVDYPKELKEMEDALRAEMKDAKK